MPDLCLILYIGVWCIKYVQKMCYERLKCSSSNVSSWVFNLKWDCVLMKTIKQSTIGKEMLKENENMYEWLNKWQIFVL